MTAAVVVVAAGAAVAIIVAGNRGTGANTSGGSTSTVAATVDGGPARQGAPAPEFRGTATDGSVVDLASLRGKVVIVNFFASWCTNCVDEMPLLQRTASKEAAKGLAIVAVNWHENGDARAFLNRLGVSFPAVLDASSTIGDGYGVTDLPESVFIGRDGKVATVFRGQLQDSTLGDALAPLLH